MRNFLLASVLFFLGSHCYSTSLGEVELVFPMVRHLTYDNDGYTRNGTSMGYGIRAFYKFNDKIAGEIGFFDSGESNAKFPDAPIEGGYIAVSARQIGIRYIASVDKDSNAFFRVGGSYNWLSEIQRFGFVDQNWGAYYGVGYSRIVGDRLIVSAEYSETSSRLDPPNDEFKHKLSMLIVAIGFKFGI